MNLAGQHYATQESLHPPMPARRAAIVSRIVGHSVAIERLRAQMSSSAPHMRLATVEGEPGTGKSLVVSELHAAGPAGCGPLIAVDALEFLPGPSIVGSAPWSEKLLTRARGGLLCLEGVDVLPLDKQAVLLQFLRRFTERVTLEGPLQLFAVASQPLRRVVAAGTFLHELAYRLTAVRFSLPPLRDRREDFELLTDLFIARFAQKYSKPIRGLAPGTLARLHSHAWPGNVRELESAMEAACLQLDGQWIRPIDVRLMPSVSLRPPVEAEKPTRNDDLSLDAAIRRHIAAVLRQTAGNKLRAARLLGISRSTLYRMLASETSAMHALDDGNATPGNSASCPEATSAGLI